MCTRELLELLAARGMDCRVFCAGVLDHEQETSLDEVLASLELPASRCEAKLNGGLKADVLDLDLNVNGVRVTLMPTASSRAERSPDRCEGTIFLDLADQVLDRFRPEVMLTYGGQPASLELIRRARARGIAVVFHLHNFGYRDRAAFADVSSVTNLHRMANTPDPRDFYRVSRAVLVPSLWRESLGRVPMEAMANGIPVLASDQGAAAGNPAASPTSSSDCSESWVWE